MTGKEWDTYFKSLVPEWKNQLIKALGILKEDPTFKKEFSNSFAELYNIIKFPFSEEVLRKALRPEPTQEQIGEWLKAAYR